VIDPGELLAAWVAVLQGTPAVASLLPGGIASYEDFVDGSNLRTAIYDQQPGSILVVWNGLTASRAGGSSALRHRHAFSLYLRASETAGFGQIVYALAEGVPDGAVLKLLHTPIHPGCFPMDLELPKAQRNVLLVGQDGTTVDYVEVTVGLVEIED
jgi:hypothetical protein